jgi:hypothetical protein
MNIYKCNLYVKFHMYSYVWFATDCNDDYKEFCYANLLETVYDVGSLSVRYAESRMPHL